MATKTVAHRIYRKTIHKYPLDLQVLNTIQIPVDSQFLSVQVQNGTICIWMLVDPDAKKVDVDFYIYGTGSDIDPNKTYLGTVQIGEYVWHIFQK